MNTDPVNDFLIRIKNAYLAKKDQVEIPYSKLKENIASVLARHGFVGKVDIVGEKIKKKLVLNLLYQNKLPKISEIKIISRPGKRVYVNHRKIPEVLAGFGITILSTPQGIMADSMARKKKLGGELICQVW